MAGKTPNKGTSKDMRLKANMPKTKMKAPTFGTPAWRAMHGK